jgi:LysM repeat protein
MNMSIYLRALRAPRSTRVFGRRNVSSWLGVSLGLAGFLVVGRGSAQGVADQLDENVTVEQKAPTDATAAPGNPVVTFQQQLGPSDLNSYLPSADRPIVGGDNPDGFDLNRSSSGSGSIVIGGGGGPDDLYGAPIDGPPPAAKKPLGPVPEFHMVKKGDTLWQVSQAYYGDPHNWPRLWSMNPQVENPHWIYPGDQLRTGPKGGAAPNAAAFKGIGVASESGGRQGFVGGSRTVPGGTVFLRDQGYIGDPKRDDWGEVVGAKEDRMLLNEGDTVYLLMKKGIDVRIGQRLNIFRPIRRAPSVAGARRPPGALVKVFGTVRIDGWDKEDRVARGTLIESVDGLERGARVGPVGRRFDVVPPKKAAVALTARVLTGIHPFITFGGQQVVFIDKGREDGLTPGNRLRAVERGDTWRRHLKSGSNHQRLRVDVDSDENTPVERTPLHGNDDKFPDEVVGELIVLRTEDYSSICLVSEASHEFEPGERVVSTVGY